MPYVLRGSLYGYICRECPRPLWGVIVRAYAAEGEQLIERAVADPKITTTALDDKTVKEREGRLLAEATIGKDGSYEIVFDEKSRYQGGPVDLDLRIDGLSHLDERAAEAKPRQIHITTLQPAWRELGKERIAFWEYYLSARIWCLILSWYDIWVICGRVTLCGTDKPLGGLTVEARDVDIFFDDYLGSAVTDNSGRFVLYYPGSAFRGVGKGELFGGPDLYFTIKIGNIVLLAEPRSRGRQPDRENVGTCFCVELCVRDMPQTSDEPIAWFTHVGGYAYGSQVHSVHPGSGLSNDGRAFFQTMRLNGVFAKTLNSGKPLEYCFEWQELDPATGASLTGWQPVQPGQIARTQIGTLSSWGSGSPPLKVEAYTVNGNSAVERVASMNGHWIEAPQESNVFGAGYFQPNGNFINLISQSLVPFGTRPPWGTLDMSGVQTGNSTTSGSAGAPLGANRFFGLRMRVREVGIAATEVDGGWCQKIAIENRLYDNVSHHPAWAGYVTSGALGVGMLDIQELQVQGCAEIQNTLTVLVTAAHPNLGAVSLSIIGGNASSIGSPIPATLTAPNTGLPDQRFGVAAMDFAATDLAPCAYIVTLSTQLMLTTGDNVPGNLVDQMAFCKAPPP